jgi:LPS-assembly protein
VIFVGISYPRSSIAESKNLQLKLSDSVSIYSEKAYRKNQGLSFEAIGNVVIISGKDTLYGEKASFNIKSGEVRIEGNVRFISGDMTIYGSSIVFNSKTGKLDMLNARIITSDFNIVANSLKRIDKTHYYAKKAEFTTCKDCSESWLIFGDEIFIELDQYVQIKHALTKIKGVSVLYFPYIAIPIKNKRESGLLFPTLSSRQDEGMTYAQPIFWAISDDKDMTFSPMVMASRGLGMDFEFRQAFNDHSYLNLTHRSVNDLIYLPENANGDQSGKSYFRNFVDIETHQQWSNNTLTHLRYTGMKDLDFISDFNDFTDNHLGESDSGLSLFSETRNNYFNIGLEGFFRRSLLSDDAEDFDKNYVQSLPKVYFSTTPYTLIQKEDSYFKNVSIGVDADVTVFKQQERDESIYIRNATRTNLKPYLNWNIVNAGPLSAKTSYLYDFQMYKFEDEDQDQFRKSAGVVTTELSFSMDRIFGLAYQQKVPRSQVKKKYLKNKSDKENKQDHLVGSLPKYEKALTDDTVVFIKNSYRHSQEFKFLHHFIAHGRENGNSRFIDQINSAEGWFDFEDAVREDEFSKGSNSTRQDIPLKNTIEFQWNNTLIKKTPKTVNPFIDNKYLRDNFTYRKIGYFSLSQGFTLDDEGDSVEDKLTRLYTTAGYETGSWLFSYSDYYFHSTSDHIFNLNFQKKFTYLNLLGNYNLNSVGESKLRTLKAGFQVRPLDTIGLSILKEQDLDARENIRSLYQVDFMPNNNCWILNFSYRETVVDNRYSFNWVFNFGNDDFKDYKTNYFSFARLNR